MADFTGPEPDAVHLQCINQIKGDDVGAFCDRESRFDASLDIANSWIYIPFAIEVVDVKIGGGF